MVDQSTTASYYHPYATLQWLHTPAGGEEQNAELLSGYVSGANTKTLTLSAATPAETGYLRCRFTSPAGDHAYSATADLTGTEGVAPIVFTVHPLNLVITETVPAVVPPVFTVHPQSLEITETASLTTNIPS